jgi:DNA-binding winged helix-turn-helix (wHTH) protein/TolB-like protein/Flp pilus assembly protein TadD
VSTLFYQFGDFRFDADRRVLWSGDEMIAVPPKASHVLAVLLTENGNLVERQELIDKVWSDSFVEEGNLNQAISALRKVLGDATIQTVPRRGYRFAAEITVPIPEEVSTVVRERQTISHTIVQEIEETEQDKRFLLTGKPWTPGKRAFFAIFAVVVSVAVTVWYFARDPSNATQQRGAIGSIAVLPLKAFSPNDSDSDMRLRITDAVITRLGTFEGLAVRPTTSILRYASEDTGAIEAGRALAVDAVLDGRLQVENDRLRVTLQLLKVDTGDQLWSEQFDGRPGEILALQDAISASLASHLLLKKNARASERMALTKNDSYEAYLKGRFLWNQRRRESYFKALEYFQESVSNDPNFALGYTGISDCYHLLQQRNELSTDEAFKRAEAAARKALELDPALPEANTSMGSVAFLRYSRWSEAETYYKRAIELNPNLPEAYARLGMLYNAWSRFDEAYDCLKKAESLDPTSVNNSIYLGANFYFSRQFDRAENQFNRILEFAPNTERAHFFLQRIYEITNRHELAVQHSLKEREVSHPGSVEPLRAAFHASGMRGFWLKQIELLKEESKDRFDLENAIASRFVLLGDFDSASVYVEKSIDNFGSMRNYGAVDPIFDPLKATARYQVLMKKAQPEI